MRRVRTQKATPKEVKLKFIKSEIDSSQITLDSFSKANKKIEKDILINNELSEQAIENKERAFQELQDIKKLVTERSQELSDLDNKISSYKDIITENDDLIMNMMSKANFELNEIGDKVKSLNSSFEKSKLDYGEKLDNLKEAQEVMTSQVNLAVEKEKAINKSIEEKVEASDIIDKTIEEKEKEIEKMKSHIESLIGASEDVRLEFTGLEEKKLILIGELKEMERDLSVVHDKKNELENKTIEIKEANVKLAEKESILDQKEQKINELYKRAGINL